MPGPRAGYRGVTVLIRDTFYGADVERSAADVASPEVHRASRCNGGADCNGAGCKLRTGKTSGELSEMTAWRKRVAARESEQSATRTAAIARVHDAA